MKEEELSDGMDRLSESLLHGSLLLGDRELKYDGYSKRYGEFLGKTMNSWKVEPDCGTETLKEKPIKREIFQGNALSQLLLVTSITPLTHILRTANLGYEF